jgi:hypothetical protein
VISAAASMRTLVTPIMATTTPTKASVASMLRQLQSSRSR